MSDLPYSYRLLALALAVSLLVLYDRRHPPEHRHRHLEYFFLLTVGAAGALFGLVNDAITSSISPDYFVAGKGLPAGPGLRSEAMVLGAQAGFSASVIGAGILLVVNRRRHAVSQLYRHAAWAFALNTLSGIGLGFVQHRFGWIELAEWTQLLPAGGRQGFRTVWCTHLGVYAGGLAGLVVACVRVRRTSPKWVRAPASLKQASRTP